MPGLEVSNLSEGGLAAHGKAGGGGRPPVPKVGKGSGVLDANGVSYVFTHLFFVDFFTKACFSVFTEELFYKACPVKSTYTVNKGFAISRPQPGCHLPNSPWPGII